MANRVEFAVTCVPVVSVAAGENVAVDTVATDMPKILGGAGMVQSGESTPSVTVDFTTTAGYSAGTVAYANINTNATTSTILAATGYDFICVRHTGFLYNDATSLGAATTMAVDIYVGTQVIGTLRPGEAIVIPLRGKVSATIGGRLQSGTTGVAIEYFGTT